MIRLNGKDVASTINEPSKVSRGTYHLADNPNLFEIQRANNFEFIISDIDGIRKAGTLGGEANATIANAQEIIRLSVSSTKIPHFSQNAIEVKRGNNSIKFAGVPTFESGTLEVIDFIGADTKAVLMAWQNLSYNVQTEKVGLATDYKKDCYLLELTPDLQTVRRWKMHGCWISKIEEDAYNNETNDKKKITATIEYDRAEIDATEIV